MGTRNPSYTKIPSLVKSGKLTINIVDTAVSRILRAKFAMGLFENPYIASADQISLTVHAPENVALAREINTESIVLLENHNQILPLSKEAKVAVIGPIAHGYMNYSDYVAKGAQTYGFVTPLERIRAASKGTVTYAKGCERWSNDESGFPEAIATGSAADVAVVIVGTWSRDQIELWAGFNATTGEYVDVSSLNLVGAMPRLVKAIIETGKPTIVVFSSGKPITEAWIPNDASALVQQFYPSEQGGNALADILIGNVNPSGKLSVGFPYDIGTTPGYYDYLNTGRGIGIGSGMAYPNGTLQFGDEYVLNSPFPLYEFGYGKSYSTFIYSALKLSKTNATASDTITATVEVMNNSTRDGAEIVQLYVQDLIPSVAVPNIALKGFSKVMIAAGQTESVSITLKLEDLGLWNIEMKYVVEPGNFFLSVGRSSADLRANATLTVS
jgi:beta-glucosidase